MALLAPRQKKQNNSHSILFVSSNPQVLKLTYTVPSIRLEKFLILVFENRNENFLILLVIRDKNGKLQVFSKIERRIEQLGFSVIQESAGKSD